MAVKNKSNNMLSILLICIATFIILFIIGSMLIVKNVYDVNFQRNDKPDPKFAGYISYSDVEQYKRTEVEFESGKNTLKGYIYGEDNVNDNDKGLVVIVHGLGEGAESYLSETLYFADNGWRVFAFDCTGSYESEGESTVGLPQSAIDLAATLEYIKSNNTLNELPIMLYGHSWGGYAVTAILNYNYDIKAVASISGFNSPKELLLEQTKDMMGIIGYIVSPFDIYQNLLFGEKAKVSAVDGINGKDTAVMIIHGVNDDAIAYNGASIISHKDEITNPNVIYKTYSNENHNGHNDLYLSDAAIKYINEKNAEYKELFDNYNGKIPDDIRAEYYAGVDKFQTSELDVNFMNEINLFFENHIKN
ncbi:MAG: hypothetical protein K0S55_503 [Clostridia bacterium]|nr:hypothetical protein [Clostridia bacterium]